MNHALCVVFLSFVFNTTANNNRPHFLIYSD